MRSQFFSPELTFEEMRLSGWLHANSVTSGSALTSSYLAMNAAATLMAGFGLLQNSPAVIIGAMLIAMLFGSHRRHRSWPRRGEPFLARPFPCFGNRRRWVGAGDRLPCWYGEP